MEDLRVSDVVAMLDELFDPRWAEDWDAVGTAVGDLDAPVRKIMFAVDPVAAVVAEAVGWGADLLVTHHPLLLTATHSVATGTAKGRVVHDLVRAGVALHTCHTNADSPRWGVSESLALALGLQDPRPLDPDAADPLDAWIVFVPPDYADAVVAAMHGAAAGAIGDYDLVSFTTAGIGSFRPLDGADPAIGTVGGVTVVAEDRIEMVAPRDRRAAVLDALRGAHPYEEPAYDVLAMGVTDDLTRGSGRIGELAEPMPLADFVEAVVKALPGNSSVARVAGDSGRQVRTVAVCGGAGDFLLDRARRAGADVFVTSDLKHHRVSEALEEPDAPAVVDVPHWAAEWTWLPVVEQRLTAELASRGATVETRVSRTVTDPWTMHVPWPGGDVRPL